MSYGFALCPDFEVVKAVDGQFGKPSSGKGTLQCNATYRANVGVDPLDLDLAEISPSRLAKALDLSSGFRPDVLIACPPCTGFSRANPENHLRDDARNGLVACSADFALALRPRIFLMENARELINGNFRHHYLRLCERLEEGGYRVTGRVYRLDRFGLPQVRERAIILAVDEGVPLRTLDDLWLGTRFREGSVTVRSAFGKLALQEDPAHIYPKFRDPSVRERLAAIPKDGGSWIDLARNPKTRHLLTNAMRVNWEAGRVGSYPDVYGRMAWDKPAPTIKRECAHIGNGRYAHPEEDRLCSVREMSVLNGFPKNYQFNGSAISNLYRHIGDAVPPMIAYQLALVCRWSLFGKKPSQDELFQADFHPRAEDVEVSLLSA